MMGLLSKLFPVVANTLENIASFCCVNLRLQLLQLDCFISTPFRRSLRLFLIQIFSFSYQFYSNMQGMRAGTTVHLFISFLLSHHWRWNFIAIYAGSRIHSYCNVNFWFIRQSFETQTTNLVNTPTFPPIALCRVARSIEHTLEFNTVHQISQDF